MPWRNKLVVFHKKINSAFTLNGVNTEFSYKRYNSIVTLTYLPLFKKYIVNYLPG